ncbi:hypothetical protein Tco_1115578 [Tanacetum coccineum]
MISNEFAIKLLLDYEEKDGGKVMEKELLVALKGDLYFVKFIINPEEDYVEPGVVLAILASVDDSDLPQLDVTDVPTPIIETLKINDQHKKLLDSVLLDKLKLDGEFELEEEAAIEEVIRSYKDIKEKNDP